MRTTKPIPAYVIRDGKREYVQPRDVDLQHTDVARTIKAARKRQTQEVCATPLPAPFVAVFPDGRHVFKTINVKGAK